MNERYPNTDRHNESEAEGTPTAAEVEATRELEPQLNPRIYITRGLPLRAELTDGAWFDMARDPQTIRAEMYAVLGEDEATEGDPLYIWDYDGFGAFTITTGAIGLEGVHSIELLSQVARGIAEHGPAFAIWASRYEDDPTQFDRFSRAYTGHYESPGAYMRQQLAPMAYEAILDQALPIEIRNYAHIDYDSIAERLLDREDIVVFPANDGGVWIFDERA